MKKLQSGVETYLTMNIENEITGSFILNDLLYAMSGACLDRLSYKGHPNDLHTEVWYPVDWQVRNAIKNEMREYENSSRNQYRRNYSFAT